MYTQNVCYATSSGKRWRRIFFFLSSFWFVCNVVGWMRAVEWQYTSAKVSHHEWQSRKNAVCSFLLFFFGSTSMNEQSGDGIYPPDVCSHRKMQCAKKWKVGNKSVQIHLNILKYGMPKITHIERVSERTKRAIKGTNIF